MESQDNSQEIPQQNDENYQDYANYNVDDRSDVQQQSFQDDQQENQDYYIKVGEPQFIDGIKKYVAYQVAGQDKNGNFKEIRRYSDFELLRAKLLERWPGIYIPYLPEKKAIGNLEQEFINQRAEKLDQFCQQIFEKQYLLNSQEFQIFIRQKDLEQNFKNLPVQTIEQLIEKYKFNFKHLSGREINTDLVQKIQSFGEFLKSSQNMLNNFRDMALNASKAYASYENKQEIILGYMLGDYEANCLKQYQLDNNQLTCIFSNKDDQLVQDYLNKLKQKQKNIYDLLENKISDEIRQLNAFQDAYSSKEQYEKLRDKSLVQLKDKQNEQSQIQTGKKNRLKSMFGNQPTQDELLQTNENSINQVIIKIKDKKQFRIIKFAL